MKGCSKCIRREQVCLLFAVQAVVVVVVVLSDHSMKEGKKGEIFVIHMVTSRQQVGRLLLDSMMWNHVCKCKGIKKVPKI